MRRRERPRRISVRICLLLCSLIPSWSPVHASSSTVGAGQPGGGTTRGTGGFFAVDGIGSLWDTDLRVDWSALQLGPGSRFDEGGLQGALKRSWTPRLAGNLFLDGRFARETSRPSTMLLRANPAIEWSPGNTGASAGGELAAIRSIDQWSPAGALLLGGRVAIGAAQLEIGGRLSSFQTRETTQEAPLRVMDSLSVPVPGPTSSRMVISSYQDAHLRMSWQHGPLLLSARAGYRTGHVTDGRRSFGGVTAGWQFTRNLAFWAESGISPSLPEQGIPARRASRLGMLVNLVRPSAEPHFPSPTRGDEAAFRIDPIGASGYAVRCRIPSARKVEISGDFCDWNARPMANESGGWWRFDTSLVPGQHRISVRVDGGEWSAPPGLPAQSDGFDGTVGLFLAP
jgi:hypothetical protein